MGKNIFDIDLLVKYVEEKGVNILTVIEYLESYGLKGKEDKFSDSLVVLKSEVLDYKINKKNKNLSNEKIQMLYKIIDKNSGKKREYSSQQARHDYENYMTTKNYFSFENGEYMIEVNYEDKLLMTNIIKEKNYPETDNMLAALSYKLAYNKFCEEKSNLESNRKK